MAKADQPTGEGRLRAEADRRSFVTLPLAQLLPGVTRPAFKKRSPAAATLMAEWTSIVGPRLAASTEPRRLARGQLTIACAGPVAMELQHLQAALIDRINTHAGEKIVEKLRFTQDHVAPRAAMPVPKRHVAAERIEGIADGPLADALSALLQAIRERT
jgi:hypothetical protein